MKKILNIFTLLFVLSLFKLPIAYAAIPTFVGCGTVTGSANAITPALPSSIATNDILLLFLETSGDPISIANQNGGTWAAVTNSPQDEGNNTLLAVFWSRYNGTQGNPTTSNSGDHQVGAICAYRGITTSGDPWDVTSGNIDTSNDTSGTIPGATTIEPETLVVIVGSGDDDADTPITTVTNIDLANISAVRVNAETNQGDDGGLTVFDGEKATVGSYGNTALTYTSATRKAMMTIALKPPRVTTIANGTNPSNTTIAPGASATDLDSFTLQTNTSTDTVTAATVTLSAGSSGGLSLVAITNDAGSTTYCSQSNPVSDMVSLTSCGIPVTTSSTQFKIRITPKSHANMPTPPGSTYSVTGTVTSFTSSNTYSGTDSSSATVTIDNASPANATDSTVTAGDSQVSVSWTNPVDSDFHSVIVLRRASSSFSDVPVEGTTYIVGNTIGTATVACVEASPSTSCLDSGLTNGTAYYYKVFSRDNYANYATGATPTGSPATPAPPADTTAPAAVTNLATSNPSSNSIDLSWTAPGDDDNSGTASSYDIRYSTSLINDGNFSSATQVSGEPTPSSAGSSEAMTVTGLSQTTTYYFALKTYDEALNVSGLSNVPSGTTTATPDTTAPAAVSDLALSDSTTSSITVSWTAPGDDNSSGTAATYDLRYSTSVITDGNFSSATQVSGEPTPSIAGSSEEMTVSGLTINTTYYFALKTSDEAPNTSIISNVPSLSTAASEAEVAAGAAVQVFIPTTVTFSGKAFPGGTVRVYRRSFIENTLRNEYLPDNNIAIDSTGAFSKAFTSLVEGRYLFALEGLDRNGVSSGILAYTAGLQTSDVVLFNDIFMPPTITLSSSRLTKGKKLIVSGYAAPSSYIELQVDSILNYRTQANALGFYIYTLSTDVYGAKTHFLTARQVDERGIKSNYASIKSFSISLLVNPKTDLNFDGKADIKDWSIFLSRWRLTNIQLKSTLDINSDGKINVIDLSVFMNSLK